MRGISRILALAAALAAAPAAAHDPKGDRALGVVESVGPERLVVKTRDGHAMEFAVTPQTRFVRGKKAAKAEDVRVGERVAVHGKKSGERVEAAEVKLGAPGK